MIDWIALFAAFGLGSLTTHFIQQWADEKRRLQTERASAELRKSRGPSTR